MSDATASPGPAVRRTAHVDVTGRRGAAVRQTIHDQLPSGWTAGGADVSNGRSVFWLDSDQAGPWAVAVSLTAACRTSGAVRIPSDQPGSERFERPLSLEPRFTLSTVYTFAGGCVTYQFSFVPGAAPRLAIPVDTAVAFEPRSALVGHVRHTEGLALSGRGPRARSRTVVPVAGYD